MATRKSKTRSPKATRKEAPQRREEPAAAVAQDAQGQAKQPTPPQQDVSGQQQPAAETKPVSAKPSGKKSAKRDHTNEFTKTPTKQFPELGEALFRAMRIAGKPVNAAEIMAHPAFDGVTATRASVYWWFKRFAGLKMTKRVNNRWLLKDDAVLPFREALPSVAEAPPAAKPPTLRDLAKQEQRALRVAARGNGNGVSGQVHAGDLLPAGAAPIDFDIMVRPGGISITVAGVRFNVSRAA